MRASIAIATNDNAGRLPPDTPLPSFRALAESLLVSLITVKRAYEELEREGIVRCRQGLGTFITDQGDSRSKAALQDAARTSLRDAIEALRSRGHRMAVASQSSLARVRFSLDVTGLAPLFGEHVYVTSMVARPKPAPDVYLEAARRLGVEPSRSIAVT